MFVKKKILTSILILPTFFFCGWGVTGHKIINKNSVLFFPPQMKAFLVWADTLSMHASDADDRRVWDTSESPKHFIDIDSYSEFVAHGRISQDYDSLVAKYGSSFVIKAGTLPWAIIAACDTLQKCFKREKWHNAVLAASDLGHYVADSHQPLHVTTNYNPGGLHTRYETTMIDKYQSQIVYRVDSIQFINNIPDFVFSTIYHNYQFVDSVINNDNRAKALAGNNYSDIYYQKLWELSGSYTIDLFKDASYKLACLIYTAWTKAGSPPMPGTSGVSSYDDNKINFKLEQNYPNPFNPTTSIKYSVLSTEKVTLEIFDILGRKVATLVNEVQQAGSYNIQLSTNNFRLTSGVYFYRLTAGNYSATRKMILLK